MAEPVPSSAVDLHSDEALLEPYPLYRELREQGSVVWLERIGVYAIARYGEVRDALADWAGFTSSHGVALNDRMNELMVGTTLTAEPPEHDAMRKILARPLEPAALRALSARIANHAEEVVDRIVARKRFDAVTDLAQQLPLAVVAELVGLPDDGRDKMLEWASAGFDALGPLNERTMTAFAMAADMFAFSQQQLVRERLKPDGWAAKLFEAADRGELSIARCTNMINDYVGPSLDTTISATASAIWMFARNPDQWEMLRAKPSLIPNAINEVIRMESPIQGFTRLLTKDVEIGGTALAAGKRVLVLYGSANRDERKWKDPDWFDISRNASDHVGFGHGVHRCVGANLARMEIAALLTALVPRVREFRLGPGRRAINNTIRGWKSLEVTVR